MSQQIYEKKFVCVCGACRGVRKLVVLFSKQGFEVCSRVIHSADTGCRYKEILFRGLPGVPLSLCALSEL